ncbi:hypothetical protein EON64_03005 [archaeon]|nr:MAG: hypothetical protein EON64_03005 [archaeon]
MSDSQQPNMEPRFIFEVQILEGSANLTIKERIGGTKTLSLLLKCSLPTDMSANPLVDTLFSQLSQSISSQSQEMKVLRLSADRDRDTIFTLSREVEEATKSKDTIQDHLLQKMCVVLNSKKDEICKLRAELKAIEAKSGRFADEVGAESPLPAKTARKPVVNKTAASKTSTRARAVHDEEENSGKEDESVSERAAIRAKTRPKKVATSVNMMRVQVISRAGGKGNKGGGRVEDDDDDDAEIVTETQDKKDNSQANYRGCHPDRERTEKEKFRTDYPQETARGHT